MTQTIPYAFYCFLADFLFRLLFSFRDFAVAGFLFFEFFCLYSSFNNHIKFLKKLFSKMIIMFFKSVF
jgi:hypothetical protein